MSEQDTEGNSVVEKRICFQHLHKSGCKRGSNCKFYHPNVELVKTSLCFDYAMGKCSRGDSCRYKHKLDASSAASSGVIFTNASLTSSSDKKSDGTTRPKNRVASFCQQQLQNGFCTLEHCKCIHVAASGLRRDMCYAFQLGCCERGSQCRFSHTYSADGVVAAAQPRQNSPKRKRSGSSFQTVEYSSSTSESDDEDDDVPPLLLRELSHSRKPPASTLNFTGVRKVPRSNSPIRVAPVVPVEPLSPMADLGGTWHDVYPTVYLESEPGTPLRSGSLDSEGDQPPEIASATALETSNRRVRADSSWIRSRD